MQALTTTPAGSWIQMGSQIDSSADQYQTQQGKPVLPGTLPREDNSILGDTLLYIWIFFSLLRSTTLYLVIGAFNSWTFKVIIDRYVFIAILLYIFMFIIFFNFFIKKSLQQTFLVILFGGVKILYFFFFFFFCLGCFITPSTLNDCLAGQCGLDFRFLLFFTLNTLCRSQLD